MSGYGEARAAPNGDRSACTADLTSPSWRALGVLGGMGPLAATDFLQKLLRATPARSDQEHLPVIMLGEPRIPDRSSAIGANNGEQVFLQLRAAVLRLVAAGAGAIAIPCNTAHHWHESLQQAAGVPIIHIAEAAIDSMRRLTPARSRVGVLGTSATMRSGFYAAKIIDAGFEYCPPPAAVIDEVPRAYGAIKAGETGRAAEALDCAVGLYFATGAERVVLGCTELPIAWSAAASSTDLRVIDATAALASACVRWWHSQGSVPAEPAPERVTF